RRVAPSLCGKQFSEVLSEAVNNRLPVARLRLPEQPRRRIPWHALARCEIAPLRSRGHHDPYWPAQRARQVDYCGLNGNDQVERREERRGFIVVVQGILPVLDVHAMRRAQARELIATIRVLQAHEARTAQLQERQTLLDRKRAQADTGLRRAAAPGDPDFE